MSEQLWRVERISGDGEKWLATDESPLSVADDPLLRLVKVEPDAVITTNGKAPVFLGMDAGTYLVFEVEDEGA